ncbi:MAG: hypothetical protein LBS87_01705, partial [Puniceicoccales bacterium]|nr:hypothetical protein [Puniceicoccales bacterium]
VRGLFGGVVGVLVGTAMPVFFGIDALCERVIFINAASVGTGIGAFIGVNKYSETPLNERNVTVLPR